MNYKNVVPYCNNVIRQPRFHDVCIGTGTNRYQFHVLLHHTKKLHSPYTIDKFIIGF